MREANQFWRHPCFGGLSLFEARFRRHRYDLHTHPGYVIALITEGCERVRVNRRAVVAPAGSLFVVNPEEWHDGEAGSDDGWGYRTFYPSIALIDEIAEELGQPRNPLFAPGLLNDPELADLLVRAHRQSRSDDPLAAEAVMLAGLRRLLLRHAGSPRPEPVEDSGSRRRFLSCLEMIDARLGERIELQQLADAAGVTRFQVIRDFRKVVGPTPAAFIRNRRVRFASALIEQGASLAEAAASAGFADQSHMSRTFRASRGVTPGSFAKAI